MQKNSAAQFNPNIQGKRVLIIEDEVFVALDLKLELERFGVDVVGPVGTLDDAIEIATSEDIDVAVVDIDLHGQQSYPAADILIKKGTPFVWHTGVAKREVFADKYKGIPIVEKPSRPDDIINILASLTASCDRQ